MQKYVISWNKLWFDVENERYTTQRVKFAINLMLWFDVENERYTTHRNKIEGRRCCGLM